MSTMDGKERCPRCGSKKLSVKGDLKKCKICGYEWKGRVRKKTDKKGKTRFSRGY